MTNIPDVPATGAAEPSAGTTTRSDLPTVTRHQELAARFMAGFEKLVAETIGQLEIPTPESEALIRAARNVPAEFLATATASVELSRELQSVEKFDVIEARDTLQYNEAYRPVFQYVATWVGNLLFTMRFKRARLAASSRQIYEVGKGLARGREGAAVAQLVADMKRALGARGGRPSLRKATPTPGIGVPTPTLLPAEWEEEEW